MIKTIVKKGDGMRDQVWLGSVVKHTQAGLKAAGHKVDADGKFGGGTEKEVIKFQEKNGLAGTGIIDKKTWGKLNPHLPAPDPSIAKHLDQFVGDPGWVHAREGHRGRPYWPGGQSGVTLDPGVDLGHIQQSLFRALYSSILSKKEITSLERFFGFKGENAKAALRLHPELKEIKIITSQAMEVFPYAAEPYWNGISRRFPVLKEKGTPGSVQTVMLSLAYNRGILNGHLDCLKSELKNKQWEEVAKTVGGMQQNHELEGIQLRRRQEGWIIKAELEFLNS